MDAVGAYAEVLQLEPANVTALVNCAASFGKLGDYARAIDHYSQALEISHDHFEAILGLAIAHAKTGSYIKAIDYYKRAIDLRPESALVHNCLGKAFAESGQKDQALIHFQKALNIDPHYAECHYNLAVLYDELNKPDSAVAFYNKAIEFNMPESEKAFCGLGIALTMNGKYSQAIRAFTTAIELNPKFPQAHYNLGIAYLIDNNREMAMQEYRTLKKIDKDRAARLLTAISENLLDVASHLELSPKN